MNDYQKDILALDKAIKANSNDSAAYYNRGLAKHNIDNYKEAILDFSQAIKLNPDDPGFYYGRGNSKRLLEDYDGAIIDYTQAIEINPDFTEAYNMRGKTKNLLHDYDGAIIDYTQAIKISPDFAYAYNNRGEAKYNLKDYKSAILDYERTIELKQDFDIAYNNRGKANNALQNYQEAIQDYSKAIEIYPDEKEYYTNRKESEFALDKQLEEDKLREEIRKNEYRNLYQTDSRTVKISGSPLEERTPRPEDGRMSQKAIEINPDEKEYYINREESEFALSEIHQLGNSESSTDSEYISPEKKIVKIKNDKILLNIGARYKHPDIDLKIKVKPLDNLKTNAGYMDSLVEGIELVIDMNGYFHSNVQLYLKIHTEKLKGHFNEQGWLESFQENYIADGNKIDFDLKLDLPFKITRSGKQLFIKWRLDEDETEIELSPEASLNPDNPINQDFDQYSSESEQENTEFSNDLKDPIEDTKTEKLSRNVNYIIEPRIDLEKDISGNWRDPYDNKWIFRQINSLIELEGYDSNGHNTEVGKGNISGDLIHLLVENLLTGIKILINLQVIDGGQRMHGKVEAFGTFSDIEFYRMPTPEEIRRQQLEDARWQAQKDEARRQAQREDTGGRPRREDTGGRPRREQVDEVLRQAQKAEARIQASRKEADLKEAQGLAIQQQIQEIERRQTNEGGQEKVREECKIELILEMGKEDMTIPQIARITKKSEEEIKQILDNHRE